MLLVGIWVEADAIWDLAVGKGHDALACTTTCERLLSRRVTGRTRLGIPKLDLLVVAGAEEALAIVRKGDVADGLGMTHKCAQALALVVDVPQLCACLSCWCRASGSGDAP
jgi:hypothetical protein